MLSLVYDILDYSQIKAGYFKPNFTLFQPTELVNKISEMFEF
jgi:hypothetical protein